MSSGFFLQDRVRTGSRPGSHPQQAAATPALRCPALCQGCWKWQQLLCQGSCTLLSRCCALYATSPGLQCPAPCRAVEAEHGHPVSPDTKGLRGPSNTVVLKGTFCSSGTRRKFELHQTSINSCFQLLRYKGPNVLLNVS